jgi:hypothetical protein
MGANLSKREPLTMKTEEELEQGRIDRCLAALEDALRRCRTEDIRYGTGIAAALDFLALHASEKWPFEQFRQALEDFSLDELKAEARWQTLNASLNGIKRAVGRSHT